MIKKFIIFLVIIGVGFFALLMVLGSKDFQSSLPAALIKGEKWALEDFAQCLSKKGVKLYGSWQDGHTQNQKQFFGQGAKYLNYIECLTSAEQMTEECKTAGIVAFPTWLFPDENRKVGETFLRELMELSGCGKAVENLTLD